MKAKALMLEKSMHIDWEGIEKALRRKYGVNAVAYNREGDRRTAGDLRPVNEICRLIKTHPRGVVHICEDVERFLEHEAAIKIRPVTEECAAGMYKLVVPVIRADDIEGFVSTCGRPFLTTERIYTHYIHETIDKDEDEIIRLLSTVDPIDPHTIKDIVAFITSYS